MEIEGLDHIVMTVSNLSNSIRFYAEILKMKLTSFGNNNERKAVCFGTQKINFHVEGQEFEPKAHVPMPGSLDLCFITNTHLDEVIKHLTTHQITIIEGPVERTGATQKIRSIYVRDPDLNLIEIANLLR